MVLSKVIFVAVLHHILHAKLKLFISNYISKLSNQFVANRMRTYMKIYLKRIISHFFQIDLN
jgi:hypothetical protein